MGAASLGFVDDAECDDLVSGVALGFGVAFASAATRALRLRSSGVGMSEIATR